MKKVLILALLIIAILIPVSVCAETEKLNSVEVAFSVDAIPGAIEEEAIFEIYDTDGVLLDTKTYSHKKDIGWFVIKFDVPEYEIGKKFVIRLASGGIGIVHCDVQSTEQLVETYAYLDEIGERKFQTTFYMNYLPVWYKQAVINLVGETETSYYHCIMDDDIYVTTDLLSKMGLVLTPHGEGEKEGFSLTSYTSGPEIKFYNNDIYILKGGVGENLPRPTFTIGGMPYVPLSVVANYFECDYKITSDGVYECAVSLDKSRFSEAVVKAQYVNEQGITSRTGYLIWVSKKDFSVNVFSGSEGKWRWVKSMPCAIGAPSTPTIEGSFEFYERITAWNYDNYYCGPVMRFKNGYALHSTLIKYDGTLYDNRVGVKISHGCVRLRPEDINWLYSITPLYTRVLVTA